MRLLLALAVSAALAPLGAWAECPTATDLEKGIVFKSDVKYAELFRILPSGMIQTINSANGKATSRTLIAKGVYLLELIDLENNKPIPSTRTTYAFPGAPADLPDPKPNAKFELTVAVWDRGDIRKEQQIYAGGALNSVTIGACTYDMFPINVTYIDGYNTDKHLLHYLPALKVAYLAATTYDNSTDTYNYFSIEVAK
ncbi:hypothetical protein N4R57_12575 [Rhodobacteraceae bacterium D3-12]|nr:hypothetical protein N4R57_12575 [Rhodobacteraceae bacterium D3-12]